MKIEIGKFYKTRSGLKARIYAMDGGETRTNIHGAVLCSWGWCQHNWRFSGAFFKNEEHEKDLVSEWTEPKPKLKAFLTDGIGNIWFSFDEKEPRDGWIRAPWLDEP